MDSFVPKKIFFTKGVGTHKDELHSFERALRDAGIEKCNLVQYPAYFRPAVNDLQDTGVKRVNTRRHYLLCFEPLCTNEPKRLLAASVGVQFPPTNHLMVISVNIMLTAQNEKQAGDYAEDLAAAMLASTLGIDFDLDESWDEKKEIFKISSKIVRTLNVTQSTICKDNKYTTVIALAVFVF